MSSPTSVFLKYVFILNFITCLVFGAWFYLAPETWCALTGWPPEYSAGRIMGGLFLVVGVVSLMGYRAHSPEQVEMALMTCLTWTVLGTIGMVWNMLTLTLPAVAGWFTTGIVALFLVLFAYVFFTHKK